MTITKKLVELAGAVPDSSGKWVPAESVEKLANMMVEEFAALVSSNVDLSKNRLNPNDVLKHFGMVKGGRA